MLWASLKAVRRWMTGFLHELLGCRIWTERWVMDPGGRWSFQTRYCRTCCRIQLRFAGTFGDGHWRDLDGWLTRRPRPMPWEVEAFCAAFAQQVLGDVDDTLDASVEEH